MRDLFVVFVGRVASVGEKGECQKKKKEEKKNVDCIYIYRERSGSSSELARIVFAALFFLSFFFFCIYL